MRDAKLRVHLSAIRGHGWHAPFGAPLPSWGGATFWIGVVVVRKTRAQGQRRENNFCSRHCERQRSNPGRLAPNLDCFVAPLLATTKAGERAGEGFRLHV